MKMLGKLTRILGKTLLFLIVFFSFTAGILFLALQTETFQTWAAHRATNYLSNELGTRVEIGKLKFSFVKNITLQDVFLEDKHHDTLVCGKSITIDIKKFDYKHTILDLDGATLNSVKVKLVKYKSETDWNFQFLADYFDSGPSTKKDATTSPWKISYGALTFKNVDFTYRLMRDTDKVVRNMNYNNIHISKVFGKITDIDFRNDTIFAQVNHLNAREQCGIVLKDLTTKVTLSSTLLQCENLHLRTANSLVKGRFSFKYSTWEDYLDFINKVYIKGSLSDSTYINFKDIAYFAEELDDFHEIVSIKGKVRGYVNDLSCTNIDFKYKDETRFLGDMSITGLPDIDKSYIHFDAQKLSTSINEIEKFPVPPFNNPTFLKLPKELKQLGVISYKGKFDGFMNNFATYGTFKTNIGTVKTDLQVNSTSTTKQIGRAHV